MKKGYRNKSLLVAGFTVLFLHLQVVKAQVTYLRASSGDIKSRYYPQNYPRGYSQEWRIEAPTGYRIRLKFKDFKLGNCNSGDFLDVWDGRGMRELCGQQLPSTIESLENEMEMSVYTGRDSTGGRFWAQYETFDENGLKTTPTVIMYTTAVQPTPPDTTQSRGSGNLDGEQRLYLLLTMMGCVIVAVIVAIFCGCKRKRRPHSQSTTPTTAPVDNANLENEVGIAELNFGDPPPSYDEVTRQSIPDIRSNTQGPSGENTSGGEADQGIDSSGLPSYREAVRLSQQSLDANV